MNPHPPSPGGKPVKRRHSDSENSEITTGTTQKSESTGLKHMTTQQHQQLQYATKPPPPARSRQQFQSPIATTADYQAATPAHLQQPLARTQNLSESEQAKALKTIRTEKQLEDTTHQQALEDRVETTKQYRKQINDALEALRKMSLPRLPLDPQHPNTVAAQFQKDLIERITFKLNCTRPPWASTLTMSNIDVVASVEAYELCNNVMNDFDDVFRDNVKEACLFESFVITVKPGCKPVATFPRPLRNATMRKVVEDAVAELLEQGIIRKTDGKSEWSAPVLIVQKEGKKPRLVCDYRLINQCIEIPSVLMPDVAESLDRLTGFKMGSSFDLRSMFRQFLVHPDSQKYTCFNTHHGQWECSRVQMGLGNAPGFCYKSLQDKMDTDPRTNGEDYTKWALAQGQTLQAGEKVFRGSHLHAFIDDICIMANTGEEMAYKMRLFFEFCRSYKLCLAKDKAHLCRVHLTHLGFVVGEHGKMLDPRRVDSLSNLPIPTNKEACHALLATFNYVRQFIPGFSQMAAPLYDLCAHITWAPNAVKRLGAHHVDPTFKWQLIHQQALDRLKEHALNAPLLAILDPDIDTFLSVDACVVGSGSVLWQLYSIHGLYTAVPVAPQQAKRTPAPLEAIYLQKYPEPLQIPSATAMGNYTPPETMPMAVAFGSKRHNAAQVNYETTRQECLAIKTALEYHFSHIYGRHFTLFSDHQALMYMYNSISKAVIRMRIYFAQFDMQVVHCKGIWLIQPDALSRVFPYPFQVVDATNAISATCIVPVDGDKYLCHAGVGTADPLDDGYGQRPVEPKGPFSPAAHKVHGDMAMVLRTDNSEHLMPTDCQCILCTPIQQDDPADALPQSTALFTHRQREDHHPKPLTLDAEHTERYSEPPSEVQARLLANIEWETATDQASALMTVEKFVRLISDTTAPHGKRARDLSPPKPPNAQLFAAKIPDHRIDPVKVSQQQYDTASPDSKQKCAVVPDSGSDGDEAQPLKLLPQNPGIVAETQTSPADYRTLQTSFPNQLDFKAVHNDEEGHWGYEQTLRRLMKRKGPEWTAERGRASIIRAELQQWVETCPTCQKCRGLFQGKAAHHGIKTTVFGEHSCDLIVFKEPDQDGNRYVIVFIDNFSKLVELFPLKNADAESIADCCLQIWKRYGPTSKLRCDRAASLTGMVITQLLSMVSATHVVTAPYHPQANSICERVNAEIMRHLRALCLNDKLGPNTALKWSRLLPFVFSIVNTTPKGATGVSPLMLVYGIHGNYDRAILDCKELDTTAATPDYITALIKNQRIILAAAEEYSEERFNNIADKLKLKAQAPREFNQGDYVLQLKEHTAARAKGKQTTRWAGPFLVLAKQLNDQQSSVLQLYNATDHTVRHAAVADCRIFDTSHFVESEIEHRVSELSAADHFEYQPEVIRSHKPPGPTRASKIPLKNYELEVKWVGCDDEENTWQTVASLVGTPALAAYAARFPGLNLQ